MDGDILVSTISEREVNSNLIQIKVIPQTFNNVLGANILPNILEANIPSLKMEINMIPIIEGELMIVGKNNDTRIMLDINGDLLVYGEDADNYSIDSDGILIYTF